MVTIALPERMRQNSDRFVCCWSDMAICGLSRKIFTVEDSFKVKRSKEPHGLSSPSRFGKSVMPIAYHLVA